MTPIQQLAALRRVNPRAELWDEGGTPLVYLPAQKIQHGAKQIVADALLAPRAHSSYSTRLFLDRVFSRGQNWTVHQICGRAWHTMSFNNVPASLPWVEILAVHLGQLK